MRYTDADQFIDDMISNEMAPPNPACPEENYQHELYQDSLNQKPNDKKIHQRNSQTNTPLRDILHMANPNRKKNSG